ncbi:MAG: alpha/beta hydrolase [Sporichthyaceae bacterium]
MKLLAWTAAIVAALVALVPIPASSAQDVGTDEVCFAAHNPGDPDPVVLYGKRFYRGKPTASTTAIVLVHGGGPTHDYWDARPDFSVARNLARAGYLVIAYDRLGYGKSPYDRARGGYRLTGSGARAMLHDVVTQTKDGSYRAATDGSCASPGTAPGPATSTVVLVGDSFGGAIVGGYPGTYGDVAAAIPTGWSNLGFAADFAGYFLPEQTRQLAAGSDYLKVVPTEATCTRWALHVPEVHPAVRDEWCAGGYGPWPAAEFTTAPAFLAENLAATTKVGPDLPILLVFPERDAIFPPEQAAAEFAYWQRHCGCDVALSAPANAGHAMAAHRSMPAYTAEIVSWLAAKGLAP